jgi:hypothetical protein
VQGVLGLRILGDPAAPSAESGVIPRLYLIDFSRRPMVYVLTGALSRTCRLEAVQYRAVVRGEQIS